MLGPMIAGVAWLGLLVVILNGLRIRWSERNLTPEETRRVGREVAPVVPALEERLRVTHLRRDAAREPDETRRAALLALAERIETEMNRCEARGYERARRRWAREVATLRRRLSS